MDASGSVRVAETFVSLQGESTCAGLPCFFVRLAGCNLKCGYCDTPAASAPGVETSVADLVAAFTASGVRLAEITGGEPLLQPGFPALAASLRDAPAATVLVETNGSLNIAAIPSGVSAILDLKCPASGSLEAMDFGNLDRLRPYDEVKFVMSCRSDFDWACRVTRDHRLDRKCRAVLFSPVAGVLDAAELGRWLLESRAPARLQVQLHKWLGLR